MKTANIKHYNWILKVWKWYGWICLVKYCHRICFNVLNYPIIFCTIFKFESRILNLLLNYIWVFKICKVIAVWCDQVTVNWNCTFCAIDGFYSAVQQLYCSKTASLYLDGDPVIAIPTDSVPSEKRDPGFSRKIPGTVYHAINWLSKSLVSI